MHELAPQGSSLQAAPRDDDDQTHVARPACGHRKPPDHRVLRPSRLHDRSPSSFKARAEADRFGAVTGLQCETLFTTRRRRRGTLPRLRRRRQMRAVGWKVPDGREGLKHPANARDAPRAALGCCWLAEVGVKMDLLILSFDSEPLTQAPRARSCSRRAPQRQLQLEPGRQRLSVHNTG